MSIERDIEISKVLPNITSLLHAHEAEQKQRTLNEHSKLSPQSDSNYSEYFLNSGKFFPDGRPDARAYFAEHPVFDFNKEALKKELYWQLYGPMGENKLSPSEFGPFILENPYLDNMEYYGLLRSYIELPFEYC